MMLLGGQRALLEPELDQRSGTRRKLRLQAWGSTAGDASTEVLIHDLSPTGILIETAARLSPGDTMQVELPYGEACEARVVWSSGDLLGCQFEQPLSKAAVSAALLKAPLAGGAELDATSYGEGSLLASEEPAPRGPGELSPRARAVAIVLLALLAWLPIAVGVALLAS